MERLLQSTGLGPARRSTFTQQLTAGNHSTEGLWQALERQSGFDAAEVLDLRHLFELQAFTGDNTSLTLQLRTTRGVRHPRSVALLSREAWRDAVLDAPGVEIPDEILPSAPPDARRAAYAEELYRSAERRYPTASLTGQLQRSQTPGAIGKPSAKRHCCTPSLPIFSDQSRPYCLRPRCHR
jgi:hypothetical protein